MDNCILKAMFDEMWDRYQDSEETGLEDIHADIMKHWRDFLSAGFDANKVAAMMPPEEIFAHYDVLTSHGAEIDATELAFKLEDADFVKEHLADFAKRGADINRIAKEWFEIITEGDMEQLLEAGVSTETVLKLAEDGIILMREEYPEELANVFSVLNDHGFSKEAIKDWVCSHDNVYVVEDVIENQSEKWAKLGFEVSDKLISLYLEMNGWRFIDDLKMLPSSIPPNKFLEYVSIEEILDEINYSFGEYIREFEDAGGDFGVIAKMFMNEIGYSTDVKYLSALFDIAWRDPSLVDLEKFIDCCKKCDEVTDEDRRDYYEDLSGREGIDKNILEKLL